MVQTDNPFEQFELRLKKMESEKAELVKELSIVRKNLFETQKKSVKDKELLQQTYTSLV